MRVITWNLNSIKTRKERLLALLERHDPDIVCLQELKLSRDNFPFDDIESAGYNAAIHAQPSYNGVAILSKRTPEAVVTGFNDDAFEDPHARLVTAHFKAQSLGPKWKTGAVISAYFPNGQATDSDKFIYKLDWIDRLRRKIQHQLEDTEHLILAGDANVAPRTRDVANPTKWNDSVLCAPTARTVLQRLTQSAHPAGLEDTFRKLHTLSEDALDKPARAPEDLSWWDYRARGWDNNDGLRIDHIYATPDLAKHATRSFTDTDERRPDAHHSPPSDHAPVITDFDL